MTDQRTEETPNKRSLQARAGNRIKKTIGIASGKGGVGKSTVAWQLAEKLAKKDYKVGILDADIHGPSMGLLTQAGQPNESSSGRIIPPLINGVRVISITMFAREGKAQILRGPISANLVQQFYSHVDWGELDYLILDLPPGTGDIHLSLAQKKFIDCVFLVTTTSQLSHIDVDKSIQMFNTLKIPVEGIIENMSYFMCDGCQKRHPLWLDRVEKKFASIPTIASLPMLVADQKMSDDLTYNTEWDKILSFTSKNLAIPSPSSGLGEFELSWQN